MLREKGTNPLKDKSFNLALRIIKLSNYLKETKKEFTLSKQLLRSGTNPGAMIREATNAETSSDFIHKLSVALKETGETQYWLELLYHSNYLSDNEFNSIYNDADEVIKLLVSSIKTKKRNQIKTISIALFLGISMIYFML